MPAVIGGIRLNMGCGEVARAGYLNVDARASGAAQYVLPAWDTSPWLSGSVDEVYSRHMLEHLDPQVARRTLLAWYNVLRCGGWLHVIVPDLLFHARQLLGEATSWSDHPAENFKHAISSIYGWRLRACGGDQEDAHRWGYTFDSLSGLLHEVGFRGIVRLTPHGERPGPADELPGGNLDEDTQPWHLNLLARKPVDAQREVRRARSDVEWRPDQFPDDQDDRRSEERL